MKKLFTKKLNTEKLEDKGLSPKGLSTKRFRIKWKLKKKPTIILSIVTVVVLFFIISRIMMPKAKPDIKYTALSKGNIVNNINVLGQVKSEKSTNVYTTLNNQVKEVNVKVGDAVKAGDVLAVLDTTNLKNEIEQATATTDATEANAKVELDSRKKAYEDALYLDNNDLNKEISDTNATAKGAKLNLDDKEKVYEYNKVLLQYGEISQQDLNKTKIDFENAQSDYDKAVISLENAKVKISSDLSTAKNNYETAKINYDNKSQRIALESKKKQLEDCQIKAPVNGIVTSVNAVVGNPSTGSLFQIEDLEDVTVTVDIKEIDISNIKVGQKAEIKTDATEDTSIDGEVLSVESIAKKDNVPQIQGQGESQSTSNNVNFQAKIKMKDLNDKIKVGMNARVNIILNEKSDIYTVPHESIVQDGDNKSIFVAEKQGDKYIIKQVPVTIGMESDFNVEISGEGISDGIFVINDPSNYPVGSIVEISGGEPIE
ncbi:efflux RND transporter periplasmic adaptor subunit [Clostridium uliginosum]|uniref:Biotin-lipoyl like n=1 Tax=Clostridium uliginosum TaxID=119641 RepID=A0A1I1J374_9CLOT|nr:efflux RND transporter periplasmic adaptor subunit [Clostridium uliginosum]SFC41058.1 Biotin-lipoyl like [Clostridium uliginosum]